MAELQGYAAKAGYKAASTWGTAVTLGDGDQIEYASESITPDVQLIDSDQITGAALSGASDTGQVVVQGELGGMDAKYNGHERFVRDVFGGVTTSADGTGFKHKFDFGLSNAGLFGTLAFDKVIGVHEIDSFKPMGLTIAGQPGQPVKLTVRGIGRELMTETADTTNDASTTWSLPGKGGATDARRLVKFGQVVTKLSPASPYALVSYCVSGFSLSFQRNGEPVQTTCDGDYSSEPSTDTVEITGQIDFPIYDDDNHVLVLANMSKAAYVLQMTFTSPDEYDTGKPYKWVIWIPGLQFTGGYPNVNGKGRVPLSMQFKAHNAAIAVDTDAKMPRIWIHNATADIDDYSNA